MRIFTFVAGALLLAHAGMAQDAAAPARTIGTWRLNFVFQESEAGKRLSAKNYTMQVNDNSMGKLNVGTRVALPTSNQPNPQYSFYEAGFNVSARVQEREGQVLLDSDIRVSTPPHEDTRPGAPPSTQQLSFSTMTAITPGKPVAILDFDDLPTRRHFTVEVTATRVK